jgi:hypothetical protein
MDAQSAAKEKYAAPRSKRSSQLPLSSAMNYALNTLHPVEILTFQLSTIHCNIPWGFDDGVRLTDTVSFFWTLSIVYFFKNVSKPTLRPSVGQETRKLVEPLDRAVLSHWAPQVLLCLKKEADPASETPCFLKNNLDDGQSPKKGDCVSEIIQNSFTINLVIAK